jgi:hypothetical protein
MLSKIKKSIPVISSCKIDVMKKEVQYKKLI